MFCNRASAKERNKSWLVSCNVKRLYIKTCQRCFFCHSIALCPICDKCPSCCTKSTCRVQTSKLLENLAENGCRTENNSDLERGLHPPLSNPAKSHKVSHCHKPLCQSPQEQLPAGGITSAYRQECNRAGPQSNISRVFQPAFSSTQTKQQVEAHTGPKQTKSFLQGGEVQNGDTGNHQDIAPARGVGNLSRLQGCLLPYTNTGTVQEIPKVPCPGPDLSIQSTAFWSVHSVHGVHCVSNLDDWLVRARSHQTCLHHTQILVKMCQDLGWLVNLEKSELEPKQVFNFVGYQFDLRSGRVRPTPDRWQNTNTAVTTGLSGPTVHVLDRSVNSHRETVHLSRLHMRPIQ